MGTAHLLWEGYTFGYGNHTSQIPLLKSYFHPNLYPEDIVVATRNSYVSFYYAFLAAIDYGVGQLTLIFFIAHVLAKTLFFHSSYHFCLSIFNNRNVARIVLLLLFEGEMTLGGDSIHWSYHTHTFAVLPVLLYAFSCFLSDRTRLAYALLGLASCIHLQAAVFVFPMFAAASLISIRGNTDRSPYLRRILMDIGIFFLCASPSIAWVAAVSEGPMDLEWLSILRVRSSHHSFPFTWDKYAYVTYALFLAQGLVMWSLACQNPDRKSIHKLIGWFSIVIACLCAIGTIFTEWIPVEFVLRAQFFRSTKFLTIFVVLYAAFAVHYLFQKGPAHKSLAILTFLVFSCEPLFAFLPLLACLYLALEFKNIPVWAKLPAAAAVLLRVLADFYTHFPIAGMQLILERRHSSFSNALAPALLISLLVWCFCRKSAFVWLRRAGYGFALFITVLYVLPRYYDLSKIDLKENEWVQLQLWANTNTPENAIFLTPPQLSGFRVFSERTAVVEWKDGTQLFFKPSFAGEWYSRLQEIGGLNDHTREAYYRALSPTKIQELRRKYNFSFVVFPAELSLPFRQVYRDTAWSIYDVTN